MPDDKSASLVPPRHRIRGRPSSNKREVSISPSSSPNIPHRDRRGIKPSLFDGRWGTTVCLVAVLILTLCSFDGDYSSNRRLLREEEAASVPQAGEPVERALISNHDGENNQQPPPSQPSSTVIKATEAIDRILDEITALSQTLNQWDDSQENEDEPSFQEPPSTAEIEANQALNRVLNEGIIANKDIQDITALPDSIDEAEVEAPDLVQVQPATPLKSPAIQSVTQTDYETLITSSIPLPQYNLASLLNQIQHFENTFAILLYDPTADEFYTLYSKKHHWASANEKMLNAVKSLTYLIRKLFPEKLEEELAIGISSGDYPAVKVTDCVRIMSGVAVGQEKRFRERTLSEKSNSLEGGCGGLNAAPILHFGSTFRQGVFTNMISMPMPESHHLKCYEEWAMRNQVCSNRKRVARMGENGLFQDDNGQGKRFDWSCEMWDTLIPQVVWRGTDFMYLQTLYPELGRPSLDTHVAPHLDRQSTTELKRQAFTGLQAKKAGLVPRWKGILHTADAELQVQELIEEKGRNENEKRRMKDDILPWCNIKFSHFVSSKGVKAPTKGSNEYKMWERIDFPVVGESLDLNELAKFKYHIDIGGGGGTTWSGTILKLALPGVLFHHVTPTKDYFHQYLKPWKHYIPVAPDLRDLKEKFDWAESHPNQARKIAQASTRLARYWSSNKGMADMFHKDIEVPLKAVIDAYVPVSKSGQGDKDWRKVIQDIEGKGEMLPILKCTGKSNHSCERMVGKGGFYDPAQIRRLYELKESSGR